MRPPMSSRSRSQGLEVQKRSTFFFSLSQPPLVISRDLSKKRGIERPPLVSCLMRMTPRLGAPHVKTMSTLQLVVSTLPPSHIRLNTGG